LARVPIVEVKFSVVPINEKNEVLEGGKSYQKLNILISLLESLTEGGEAMVIVNLKRLNKGRKQHVLISNFPKMKEACWFIVITNPKKKDVLALKRVSFNRFATKNVNIALPDDFLDH
jgi:hypothetical protein